MNYVAALVMNIVIACSGIGISLLVTRDPRFQLPHVYALLAFMFALAAAGSVFGSIFLARWSDRIGRRPMILLSLSGFLVTAGLLGVVGSWAQLFVVVIVQACCLGTFWPSLEARITDGADGRQMARRLGTWGIAISIGLLPGPVIGGTLSDLWIRAPFYGAALLGGLLLAVLAVAFRGEKLHDGHRFNGAASSEEDPLLLAPSTRRAFLISAWVANGALCAAASILRGIFPRFASLPETRGGLGMSGFEAGLILAAISLSMLPVFVILGRYPFWHYRLRYLLMGQGAAIAGCLFFALCSSLPMLATGALLYGVGGGVTYFSSIYYSLHAHTERGTQSGLHEAVMGGGFISGMLITATFMWYSQSHRTPYWICIGIVLAGITAQIVVVARARDEARLEAATPINGRHRLRKVEET
ncbi:MAG: MFS transporter [Pirellulales bacterium]